MTVQVIPDHPVINDQQRPGLVRVHGVDVAGHVRVEDLNDAGHLRSPGTDPRIIGHAKIVQDRHRATVFDVSHGYVYSEPVRFDTKIAVLLRDDLEVWQRLNVTAFLVSGIGPRRPK